MKKLILIFALSLSALPALADSGWYGFAGFSHISGSRDSADAALGAGYRLSKSVAAEVGFFDPGVVKSDQAGSRIADRKVSGVSLSGVFSVPIGAASLSAIAGAYYLRGKFEHVDLVPAFQVIDSGSGSGLSPVFGIGASYRFSDAAAIRATYESIDLKDGLFGDGHDLERLRRGTVAFQYSF